MIRTKITSALLTLLTSLAPISAQANLADGISLAKDPKFGTYRLYIKGDIRAGDADIVEDIFREAVEDQDFVWTFLVDNNGGSVNDAMDIGRMIRAWDGMVDVQGHCYSSCALIYVAGSHRTLEVDAQLGLHRPYFDVQPGQDAPNEEQIFTLYRSVASYLDEMNVAPNVHEQIMATEPEEMRVYHYSEIDEVIPTQDPVYAELSTISRARRYGISTVEYRRITGVDTSEFCQQFAPYSERSAVCGLRAHAALYWGLSPTIEAQINDMESAARAACSVEPTKARALEMVQARKQAMQLALETRNPAPLRSFRLPEHIALEGCIIEKMRP